MRTYIAKHTGGFMAIVTLTPEREGQIALKVLRHIYRKKGMGTLNPIEFKREMGNLAKSLGIETDELMQFAEKITRELIDEVFTNK